MDTQKKELFYFQITDLWKKLCEEHSVLFDQTCDEYSLLLGSQIEELEVKIEEKQETIAKIGALETIREELISNVNKHLGAKITNVSELIIFFQDFEHTLNQKHLKSFNALLIDIIEKIQVQNKNNQLFINKALGSLKSIREEALGEKSYSTYNNKGSAKARSLSV
ncbi:flagellar export chaperone FlgN [Halobacteriovorax sp. HLS]|uniref:flagellar export chaperone FlgN n=1 Tax=Halobacteriovorax sp. HLS TaxID=2234000 RepID=UPI000FD9BDDD|nr:flagellar export chaperone FlgN [Halobacteriovorax sp. HLS]